MQTVKTSNDPATRANDVLGAGNDVVTFLKGQHQQIKGLFDRVLSAKAQERAKAFVELRRLLAVHETAEEEIVHPAARRALSSGNAIVEARLREENEAKTVLSNLEKLDLDSPAFETEFRTFKQSVIAHAEAEEREEFDALAIELDKDRLDRMKKAVQLAEAVAPTRPHPGVESATANLLVGPFAAMIDRVRDAISGKS